MKLIRYIGFTFLVMGLIISASMCKTAKSNDTLEYADTGEADTITIKNDSLDYEIQILEVGFSGWLQTQRPRGYYSQSYLENWNWRYVTEYNIRADFPSRYGPNLYPMKIDYDPDIDYGYEVNYLLYHFFKFFEQKYNQNLLR